MKRLSLILAIACLAPAGDTPKPAPDPDLTQVLASITSDSLRGDLSFLASDLLKGRWTPSPGLDIAAEFIASRLRAAGVESGNDQRADLTQLAKASSYLKGRTLPESIICTNVIGVLRGADPQLSKTYVVVSAHYDHLGTLATSKNLSHDKVPKHGDRIFNGANDDGSGTVSMIAVAAALARMPERPKRSIVFIAFCGEELGLLGSRYYIAHPVFPLKQTVGDINLEQLGRTDSDIGKGNATLTGYDYTDIARRFEACAPSFGLKIVNTSNSDTYFKASDNLSFAQAGIPDSTLATSLEFPDYHGLGDEWQKIDYSELVQVTRLVVRVVWDLANDSSAPRWIRPYTDSAASRPARSEMQRKIAE